MNNINNLLNLFKTGKIPTEEDFKKLIKSSYDNMCVPEYWESHLNSKIKRIKSLQDEDGVNRFSIGFITDMHLEGNNDMNSGSLMNEIDKNIHMPIIINGGDCISHYRGATSKENALNQIQKMFNMFSTRVKDKMLYMVANHDDNSHSEQNWNNTLKEGELYSQFYRHLDNKVIRGETPRYYYLDNEFHKTRFIVLDCNDVPYIEQNEKPKYPISNYHAFRKTQLEWFSNVALNVPEDDWSVLVTCHAPPYSNGVNGFDRPILNGDLALGILSSFKKKSVFSASSKPDVPADFIASVSSDFSGKGGNVICWITGDTHTDNIVVMNEYSDINLVTTINDHKNRFEGEPQGSSGTTTEQAFDIITIDRKYKKVFLTRIGAGVDREFYYGNNENNLNDILFEDYFDVDSSSLGSHWEVLEGQFSIINKKAKPLIQDKSFSVAVVEIQESEKISVECELTTNDDEGLVLRVKDKNNYIQVMMEKNDILSVKLLENGLYTNLSEKYFNRFSSMLMKVEISGSEIKVFINGNLQLTANTGKLSEYKKYGIKSYTSGSSNGEFDNFLIKKM